MRTENTDENSFVHCVILKQISKLTKDIKDEPLEFVIVASNY